LAVQQTGLTVSDELHLVDDTLSLLVAVTQRIPKPNTR